MTRKQTGWPEVRNRGCDGIRLGATLARYSGAVLPSSRHLKEERE